MNSNSLYNDFFSPRDATQSAVLPQYSVCLSVPEALQVPVTCSHRLEFFENNFTAEYLKAYALAQADQNVGDLVQRKHPKITVK